MKKILALSVVLLAFSAGMFAQLSATDTATATIVSPLSIVNAGNMNFGKVAVGAGGGTVVLTPAGGRSTTGDVALPTVIGTVTPASLLLMENLAHLIQSPCLQQQQRLPRAQTQ